MRVARCVLVACMLVACVLIGLSGSARADSVSIRDLEAVNETGNGTHESLGWPNVSDPDHDTLAESKVVVEGILLNQSADYLNPASTFQVYVQGDDGGGVAVYAAKWYGYSTDDWAAEYARMSKNPATGHVFQAGDRVRVTGLTMFYRGKTNINERHESDTDYDVTLELIAAGEGMPDVTELPSISQCKVFDQTRATGGELYQGTWCQLQNVWIASGTWGAGNTIQVTDNGTDLFPVLLSAMGDFNSYSAPAGKFNVTGIFDQEDTASPYTEYRFWVKDYGDFGAASSVPEPAGCAILAIGLAGAILGTRRRRA